MFERLDKLRADVEHCRKRVDQSRMKLKEAEDKLKEAEKMQILSDVKSMNLSPEQLNELLALAAGRYGGITDNGSENDMQGGPDHRPVILSGAKDLDESTAAKEAKDPDETTGVKEMEDSDNED